MSTQEPQQPQFSDEELRAIEAEMQKITVDDVLLQTIVTLLNVGARKAGLASPPPAEGETPPEPDLEQVRQAVDGARALLPLVEPRHRSSSAPSATRSRACRCSTRSARAARRRRTRRRSPRSPEHGPRAELRQALGSGAVGVRAAPRGRLRRSGDGQVWLSPFAFDLTQRGSPCPTS